MRGAHEIRVHNRRLDYRFEVRRNITVVRGDSGTGKTTLYEMVADYTRLGRESGVQLSCDCGCVALVDLDWKAQLARTNDSIVFIDEGAAYIRSTEFAVAARESGNYFVIFSREALYALPYSVDEVYRIVSSGRYHHFEHVYEPSARYVYGSPGKGWPKSYDTMLVEDSQSGYEFFRSHLEGTGMVCVSAGGNAGVYRWLKVHERGHVFVLADGAAFGAEAGRVLLFQARHADTVTVCLPESFEWLVLASGIIRDPDVEAMLAQPGARIDSEEFFSWEQFFTAYLIEVTRGTPFEYSKASLAEAYTIPKNANKVVALIADENAL